ncbi:DUF2065 domain-containing protein [Agaribacter flavus]|uniref:DUF2065 domain-containing protein n=1 Tax=Agaribacter flavus TaxID=1902781 RepID=A0ABV7FU96_9ALTE
MEALFIAICLVMIIEGLGPLLWPNKWGQFMRDMAEQPPTVVRRIGGVLVVSGSVILWFLLH